MQKLAEKVRMDYKTKYETGTDLLAGDRYGWVLVEQVRIGTEVRNGRRKKR